MTFIPFFEKIKNKNEMSLPFSWSLVDWAWKKVPDEKIDVMMLLSLYFKTNSILYSMFFGRDREIRNKS